MTAARAKKKTGSGARLLKDWRAWVGVAVVVGVALIVYLSGGGKVDPAMAGLSDSLRKYYIEPAPAVTARLRPGMVLRLPRCDLVADADMAFEVPAKVTKPLTHDNWMSGTFEDGVEAQLEGEMGILELFGLEGSREKFKAEHVSRVRTEVDNLTVDELTETSIEEGKLTAGILTKLRNETGVVLVQKVAWAKELRVSYLNQDKRSVSGDLPKIVLPGNAGASAASTAEGKMVFSNAVVGFQAAVLLDLSLVGDQAGAVQDEIKKKGYEPRVVGKLLFVPASVAQARDIVNVVKAKAEEVKAPPAAAPTAKAASVEAIKRVPMRMPVPTTRPPVRKPLPPG